MINRLDNRLGNLLINLVLLQVDNLQENLVPLLQLNQLLSPQCNQRVNRRICLLSSQHRNLALNQQIILAEVPQDFLQINPLVNPLQNLLGNLRDYRLNNRQDNQVVSLQISQLINQLAYLPVILRRNLRTNLRTNQAAYLQGNLQTNPQGNRQLCLLVSRRFSLLVVLLGSRRLFLVDNPRVNQQTNQQCSRLVNLLLNQV